MSRGGVRFARTMWARQGWSAAAAPPQQVRRDGGRRLGEPLGFQPGISQGVQDGGQLAVRRAHPDPDPLGIVTW